MPTFKVQAPDGSIIPVNAPDGATEQQAIEFAAQTWKPSQAQQPLNQSWGDVAGNAISNVLPSAGNFIGGIAQTVMHPIKTAGTIFDAAAGGLHNVLPESISSTIDKIETNPEAAKRAIDTANTIGGAYKDRYGSMDALKNTLATDPIGAAADISTVLTGGAVAASKIPMAAKLADALRTGAGITNPATAIAPIAKSIGNVAGFTGRNVLGLTTGVGPENISQAYRAGVENNPAFIQNLSSSVPMTDVLDQAKSALDQIRQDRSSAYRNGIAQISNDKTILDFQPIKDALQNQQSMGSYKGKIINSSTADTQSKIAELVNDWGSSSPQDFHTPEGLDALKKAIGDVRDSTQFGTPSRKIADSVYNAVKNQIVSQAPDYANTMKDYENASQQIKDIEQGLSLGNKASVDTAMRKLQSLTRNNVNTNYNNRLNLAEALNTQGGQDILPSVAGQAMNSWLPRGLVGQAEGLATLGTAALHNPAALALLPVQSPKVVGASVYGLGQGIGAINDLSTSIPINKNQALISALLAGQAGQR